ncbi:MAG: DUF5658 family protein [Planctomycetota bacterium]|jgi:hypothetical protein
MPSFRSTKPAEQPTLFGVRAQTIALVVLFLASIDSLATILAVRYGTGRELNPVMDWLMNQGEPHFLLSKLLLTALCVQWMVNRASHPYARVAALVGLAIYVPIVSLHIVNNLLIGMPL